MEKRAILRQKAQLSELCSRWSGVLRFVFFAMMRINIVSSLNE